MEWSRAKQLLVSLLSHGGDGVMETAYQHFIVRKNACTCTCTMYTINNCVLTNILGLAMPLLNRSRLDKLLYTRVG